MIRKLSNNPFNKTNNTTSALTRDTLIENMNDGILVLDKEGLVLDANRATMLLTGLSEEDLLGKPAPKEFRSSIEKSPSDPEATRARIEIKWEQPVLRYLDLSISPIHDKDGQLIRRLIVLRDITKQKQIEKALRFYNNRLNILREIDLGILKATSLEEAALNTLVHLQKILACQELRLIEYNKQVEPILLAEIRPEDAPKSRSLPGIETLDAPLFQGKIAIERFSTSQYIREGFPNQTGEHAVVHAPLLAQSVPRAQGESYRTRSLIGLLSLTFYEENDVTEADLDLLNEITHEISATLQNARLQEETRRRALQLQVASEIARDIASARELSDLINRTVSLVGERFGYYHAAIYLLDEKNTFAVLQAATGEDGEKMLRHGHKFKSGGSSLVGQTVATGQPQIADNFEIENGQRKNPYLPQTRSELVLPLKIGEKVIGSLDVHCDRIAAFDLDDAVTLQILADQLAIAVDNARLNQMAIQRLDETVRQVGELAVLYAVAQAGAESTSEDELIERVTQVIGDTLYPDNFGILLVDEEEKFVITHPSYRGVQSTNQLGKGITGRVAADGRPHLVADVAASSGYIRLDQETRSELCVPLKIEEKVIGVLNAESKKINTFTLNDERLLITVAGLLATAIQKIRLHTDLQKQARDLVIALEKQKELDRLKSQFIQNVSHELRTPLAIIRGYAELLDSGDLGEIDISYKDPISTIARRAAMLSNMVDDLIAILEAEERSLKKSDFDLGSLIKTMMDEFQISAQNEDISLTTEVAPNLPPFHGDADHLRRVADNLISNALKFTPRGGQVSVSLRVEGDQFVLRVSDTGIGIPDDELERIFERFYQVDGSMSRRYGGTGLGLSLVHEIVIAHQGRISVQSKVNEGTTFTIQIPVKTPALASSKIFRATETVD
ncbi:MAG TPA: GAF domain-containing protein [Anaerolineales bacterium]|nr:GAF domain-containing protein [Anaerolineales bacterium]